MCSCCKLKITPADARYKGYQVECNGRTYHTWAELAEALGVKKTTLHERHKRGLCLRADSYSHRRAKAKRETRRRPTDPMSGFLPLAQEFCLRQAASDSLLGRAFEVLD